MTDPTLEPARRPPWLMPFWHYYGGKWRLARTYPAPRYPAIVEPFAGAAGYSLRHYRRRVTLVERYDVVAEIWRFLIAARPEDVMRVPLVDCVDDLPPGTPVGARNLVGFAMNFATTTPNRTLSAGQRHLRELGQAFGGWTEAMRARVAGQVGAIKHWTVVEGDALDVAPDVEATWFVDPPYEREGDRYPWGARRIDYAALGRWCRSRRGQVIVCETVGASWLPFRPHRAPKASPNARPGGRRVEAVWTSGDTQPELALGGAA